MGFSSRDEIRAMCEKAVYKFRTVAGWPAEAGVMMVSRQ
jgi:hypothetical protein